MQQLSLSHLSLSPTTLTPAPTALEAHDMFLEMLPLRVTAMLDRTYENLSIGAADSSMSAVCLVGAVVVLFQMTVVLRGAAVSRTARLFVVEHFLFGSEKFLRFTPIVADRRGGGSGARGTQFVA